MRTVGHRGILHPTGMPHLPIFLVIADARTAKIAHAHTDDRAEFVWYSPGSREQFRVAGRVRVYPDATRDVEAPLALRTMEAQGFDWEKIRTGAFEGMPPVFRANYVRPPPGEEMDAYEQALEWPAAVPNTEGKEDEEDRRNYEEGLGNVCLFLLEATEVDYVAVGGRPHKRTRFVRSETGEWSEKILVP